MNFCMSPGQNLIMSNTLIYDQIPAEHSYVRMLTQLAKTVNMVNIMPGNHQHVSDANMNILVC